MGNPNPDIDKNLFTEDVIKLVQDHIDEAYISGEYVTKWEKIQPILTKRLLAWVCHLPPDIVGVDPLNRSKLGVGGSESHEHGKNVTVAGWSWKKSSDAVCSQVPPDPWYQEFLISNDELTRISDGLVPPLRTLQYMSAGGSHTNTFLRAVRNECKTSLPKDALPQHEDGRLNKEAILMNRPELRKAVEEGMNWLVLHWQCRFVWPQLVPLIVEALNTEAKGDQTEVEIMLRMNSLASTMPKLANGDVNWDKVSEQVMRSLPSCAGWSQELTAYVRRNGGGNSGELLHDLARFQKAFASKGRRRMLGGEFIGAVTKLKLDPAKPTPFILQALLEVNLCGPTDADGMCRFIKPTTVGRLKAGDNQNNSLLAEAMMADARRLAKELHVEATVAARFTGQMDVRLICFLLNQQGILEETKYESVQEIGQVPLIHLPRHVDPDLKL